MKILDTMNVGTVGLNVGNIQAYQSAIKGLSAEQAVFALATKGANAAQIEEIMTTETATLAKGTYAQADVQAAMAKHGLATASAILTVEQQKEIINSGLLSAEKIAEMASVLGLTTAENGSLVSKKALNVEMVKQQLTSIGVVGATQTQIMSILGLTTAETGAVVGTNLLTASFAKLWAVISAHPIGAIITAVGALAVGVVSAVNASNKAREEARKTAIQLTNTYTQEKDSLDSQIEKYKELKETLDNENLSTNEIRSTKEQLLGIQESLIESYGNEASNIDLVNGKYREQLGLLSELSKEKSNDYVIENRDVFKDAKKALEKERTYNLGTITNWNDYSPKTEDQQKLLDYIETYSDLLELTYSGTTGHGVSATSVNLSVKADVESADKIMHQFATDLEKYGKENGVDVSEILEGISVQLKETWTDELTEYKTVYDEFMKAEVVRNDTLRPLYQESIQAVEDYNKALSTGEGIEEAKANLESVQQSVQSATVELEGSQGVFDGIYEGINKDAEAAYNLGKAFENDKTVKSYAEQLRGLTDIDLKAINFDNDNTEKGEEAFKGLMETLGLTEEQVQSLINKLVELGYVQGEVQGSTLDNKIDVLSLDDAKSKILGDSEKGVTGLIDELTLLQEVLSNTGDISQETYEKLLSCSKDYATAIRTENGRITLNTNKLKQVAKQRGIDTKATIKQTLALKKQEWLQWKNKIENYNGTLLDSIETKYDDIDALQAEITQYELLVNSLDNATSAFERFKSAQDTDDQDMYDTTQDAFNVLKEYSSDSSSENYGKYNRDEFQEAAMLLMDTDTYTKALNAKDLTEYQKVVQGFVKSISPLFDENNAKSASKLFDEVDKIVASGDVPVADQDWADRLGISKEAFNALKQLGNLYDYNNKEVFESFPLDKLDDYQEKVSNVAEEYKTLNSIEDKTSNEYLKQEQAYKQAKEKRDAFIEETTTDMSNAFTNYQKSGGMDGRTFADYVKDQFDFEDTDVTGSMFALIDKADTLKEKLNTISPNKDVQKQFEEYDQLQMITSVLSALGYEYEKVADNKEKYTQSLEESTNYEKSHKKAYEEELKSFEELKKQEEQFKRQMASSVYGSEMYTDAQNGLTQVQSQLDGLRSSLKMKLEFDISDVEAKIGEVEKAKEKFKQDNSGLEDTIYYRGRMSGYESELEGLNSEKSAIEKQLKIVVEGDDEAKSTLSEIEGTELGEKTVPISANDLATPIIDKVIQKKIPDKEFNINAKVKMPSLDFGNEPANSDGGAGAFGTVNIKGSAYADGNIGTNQELKNVMVGEIQPEMVVDPHSGEYTIYQNPTMLDKLPKDAIVFNGKQTEEILKNGMTTSFGKAYATGTKVNIPNFNDVNNNNVAIKSAKQAEKAEETIEKVEEEAKELTEELFDWIERRIQKLQRYFDRWINNAEAMLTKTQMVGGLLAKYYKRASGNLNKQMDVQSQAYGRYMQQADASGLSDDYKKKVQDGLIDIETITDDELKEQISSYQEWYDKANESLAAFEEAANKRFHIPLDKAAKKVEVFGDAIDLLDKKLDNAIGATAKNKLIGEQSKEEKKTLNAYKVAQKESAKNLKSQSKKMTSSSILKGSDVSKKEQKKIKEAVKSGKEIDIAYFEEGSKAYKQAVKYNEALRANTQAQYDLNVATEEYKAWLVEASKMKFDNIADEYENTIKQIENNFTDVDNKIAEIEAVGKRVDKSLYESQKKLNDQELAKYKAELVALEESKKGIKQGTDEWFEALDAIQEVENAISKCNQETAKLNKSITELHYSMVDDIANMINGINEEQDFLQGLFGHEKLTDDDTGNFTEAGIAKLGSVSTQYYASKEKAENAKSEVDILKYMKDNNLLSYSDGNTSLVFNSPEELDEQYKQRYKVLQDEITEAYNKEKELFDLMEQKYQAELSYISELIDAQKDALQRERDLHNYQKQIAEKTKNINTIQSQISAYKGDTSEEGRARLQKLQDELEKSQDDLKETEYDRYISDQQDMLDKLKEEYEESITNQLENFKSTVSGALGIANDNTSRANTYLAAIAKANGYEIKEDANLKNIEKIIETKTAEIKDSPTTTPDNSNKNSASDSSGNNGNQNSTTTTSTPQTMPVIPADNTFSSIRPDQIKNEWETKRKEVEAIFGNKKYYAKGKKSKASDYKTKINQYLFEKNGKVLSNDGLKALRNALGTNNAGLYNAMVELKKHIKGHVKNVGGFKTGGIAKLVKSRGEDGFMLARNGEGFVQPEHVPAIQELLDTVPLMNDMLQPLVTLPKFPDITSVGNTGNNILQIDTLNLPNVTNWEEFKDKMYKDMQSNKKFEGMVQDMSVNKMSGGGRLTKYRQHF